MANVALEAYAGFAQHSFVSDEKVWAGLKLNKGGGSDGKYDFTGDSFVLQTSVFTGLIDGDDYWLMAVLGAGSCNPKGGTFEFKAWKAGTDGAKGSFDKTAAEAIAIQWQKDGCFAAIHCNDIPVLKTMVKVLHEAKIIAKPGSGEITVRLNSEATDMCPQLETALSEFWFYLLAHEGNTPDTDDPAYAAAGVIAAAGLMSMPCLSSEDLPSVPLYDLFGKKNGVKVECFPFSGELPSYDAVTVTLPKKEEKKSRSGGGYGAVTVDPKAVLEAREKYFITQLALHDPEVKTLADAINVVTTPKSPLAAKAELLLKVMGQ
ncbi:hypothetical protein [Nostoc sp. PA-18-2419]|uniref:hypothetical protein n=1 Tax=Nostoc sp. PA-18-2419 TaxID=2575443 RepID=UPI001109135D|nr:hypothetical protein [Nostoc sp. PA-18-2419]